MIAPLLALVGACLVVFGAREPLVHMPMGDTTLADASQWVPWALRGAAVVVLVFVACRIRWAGWLAWIFAVGALGYVGFGLWSQVAELKRSAEGEPDMLRFVEQSLAGTRLLPGTVYLVGGLLVQLLALIIRPRGDPQKMR